MAIGDPAAPAPADPAAARDAQLSALYQDYNPQGGMGGLFAPAYIHGLQASENAVANWQAQNHPVTYANIDQTRMPNPVDPNPVPMSAGNGVYGGPMPLKQAYGDPKGTVDPLALQVLAQGGKYDFNARRDAIAQRVAANTAATAAPADSSGDWASYDTGAYQDALNQYNTDKRYISPQGRWVTTPPKKGDFAINNQITAPGWNPNWG